MMKPVLGSASKWGRPHLLLLLATVSLAACDADHGSQARAEVSQPVARPAMAADQVARANALLRKEEKVLAANYSPGAWAVDVADDGTKRDGLAEYLCLQLKAGDLVPDDTVIRIQSAAGADLGEASCPA